MKELEKFAITFILTLIIGYISMSIIEATLDLTSWSKDTRITYGVLVLAVSLIAGFYLTFKDEL